LTPAKFVGLQRAELSAKRMRDVLTQGVTVSESAVKEQWVRDQTKINLQFVRFPYREYMDDVEVTPEALAAYMEKESAAIKKEYEDNKFRYENLPKERKLAYVSVALPKPAEAKSDADKTSANVEKARMAATQKLEKAAERVRGGADLKTVATELGLAYEAPGWKREQAMPLGLASFKEAIMSAEDGALVGPQTPEGDNPDAMYLVHVKATREGDQSLDDVKPEIAENLYRQEKAKAMAKQKAEAALEKARSALAKAPSAAREGGPDDTSAEGAEATGESATETTSDAPDLKSVFPATEEPSESGKDGAPKVAETGPFARTGGTVPMVGRSEDIAEAVWNATRAEPFVGPVEEAGSYYVFWLKERQEADVESFDSQKQDLIAAARRMKGFQTYSEWVEQRCAAAKARGDLNVNASALKYGDQPPTAEYVPCERSF
jgi:hypothetical protein